MPKFIKNEKTGKLTPIEDLMFAHHLDEAGLRKKFEDTPTLSFIEVGGEAPAEDVRDEEPAKKEEPVAPPVASPKPSGFLRVNKDTQKGVN